MWKVVTPHCRGGTPEAAVVEQVDRVRDDGSGRGWGAWKGAEASYRGDGGVFFLLLLLLPVADECE